MLRKTADWTVGKPLRILAWMMFFPLGWYLSARHKSLELARQQVAATRALQPRGSVHMSPERAASLARHPSSSQVPPAWMN
jgi:hypothetical protein